MRKRSGPKLIAAVMGASLFALSPTLSVPSAAAGEPDPEMVRLETPRPNMRRMMAERIIAAYAHKTPRHGFQGKALPFSLQVTEAHMSTVKHMTLTPRQRWEDGVYYYCIALRGTGTLARVIGPTGSMYGMEIAVTISNLPFGLHGVSRDFRILRVWTPAEDGTERFPLCRGRFEIPFPEI